MSSGRDALPHDEPDRSEEPGTPEPAEGEGAPRPVVRWWLPVALGAAVVLAVLGAFPPWPDGWVDGLGTSPWWVVAPALAVAALLVLGVGGRRWAWWAVVLAGGTAVLGGWAFARSGDSGEAPGRSLARQVVAFEPRPVAPLAAAVACAAACAVAVFLARRRAPWLDLTRPAELPGRLRRLTALALAGAVLGTGASLGAGVGAERVQRALDEEPELVDATAEPVPDGDRPLGAGVPFHTLEDWNPEPVPEPGEVAWQETLPGGAVEATTCLLDERPERGAEEVRAQTTLIAVEEVPGGDAVVGYDAADGNERWRYTVHAREAADDGGASGEGSREEHGEESRLGQVAVAQPCTVLVVVDPYTVVALDSVYGDVRNVSLLPVAPGTSEPSHPWRFPLASAPYAAPDDERAAPSRLVSLDPSPSALLASASEGLVELDRTQGGVRGYSTNIGSRCDYLVEYPNSPYWSEAVAVVLVQECVDPQIVTVAPRPAEQQTFFLLPEEEVAELHGVHAHASTPVPYLGCAYPPHLTDLSAPTLVSVGVVGVWCAEEHDGPVLIDGLRVREDNSTYPPDVVPLPGTVEPPAADPSVDWFNAALHPQRFSSGVSRLAWLHEGELHHAHAGAEEFAEAFVTTDEPLASVLPPNDHPGAQFYALTESGTLLAYELVTEGEVNLVGSTEVAVAPCSGERELLLDPLHAQLLALCHTESGTEVTAVTEGDAFVPADAEG